MRTQPVKRVAVASLAVLAACALVASAQPEWKTSVPFTYLIDYSQGHVDNPEYLKKIAEAPPTLMHVGEDVVFSSVLGTKGVYGGPQGTRTKLITADEAQVKLAELQQYTAAMHRAGVKWIIPYINNLAVLGDHKRRTGFWEFFDHWDRFRDFGFGPRAPEDIVTAQMFSEFPHPERLKDNDPNYPYKRYEMCVNNPIWRNYLLAVTLNIARTGMDGVFADEMILRDYCPYDQAKFRDYVGRKYDAAERRQRFGQGNLESLRLGYPGEGALWHETQAFWSWSLGEFLKEVRDAGRKVKPDFFVMANVGPFAHIDGAYKRASGGKDPREWAPYSRLIMFEEMQRPGQLGPDVSSTTSSSSSWPSAWASLRELFSTTRKRPLELSCPWPKPAPEEVALSSKAVTANRNLETSIGSSLRPTQTSLRGTAARLTLPSSSHTIKRTGGTQPTSMLFIHSRSTWRIITCCTT